MSNGHPPGPIDIGPIRPSPEARHRLSGVLREHPAGLDLLEAACALIDPGDVGSLLQNVQLYPGHRELSLIRVKAANLVLGALQDDELQCELRLLPPGLAAEFVSATAAAVRQLGIFDLDLAKSEVRTEQGPRPALIFARATGTTAQKPGKPAVDQLSQKSNRGPKPGTLRRYEASDRALFPEIDRLTPPSGQLSPTAAARKLAEEGKVAGTGSLESRAKRIAALYIAERRAGRKSTETG